MRKLLFTLLTTCLVLGASLSFAADVWNERYTAVVPKHDTGAAALSFTVKPPSGEAFQLLGFYVHLSAAPTTSENFTVTIDSGEAAAYDTLIYSLDFSVGSVTDLVKMFDEPILLTSGDEVDFAWTNTDTRTYGVTTLWRRMK